MPAAEIEQEKKKRTDEIGGLIFTMPFLSRLLFGLFDFLSLSFSLSFSPSLSSLQSGYAKSGLGDPHSTFISSHSPLSLQPYLLNRPSAFGEIVWALVFMLTMYILSLVLRKATIGLSKGSSCNVFEEPLQSPCMYEGTY